MAKQRPPRLIAAVLHGDMGAAADAIDSGDNVDVRDAEGRTALMHAVLGGSVDGVRLLLACGAAPNGQDMNGYTALHFASQEHQAEIAKLLLQAGARVDCQDVNGNTPLWRAVFASRGRGEMIELLLSYGPNRHLKNESDVSPYDLAQRIGNYDVAHYL